jgi:hypothetical protein
MSTRNGVLVSLGLPLVMCLGLAACGGNSSGSGGGDGSPVALATNLNAEGAWHSEQSNGDVMDLVLLENGSLYAMSAGSTATTAPLLAFDQGTFIVLGDKLTAQVTHYNESRTQGAGAVTGTVVQSTSIAGSATGGSTRNYSVLPTASFDSRYSYNSAASLSSIEGPWVSGYSLENSTPMVFTIDGTGVISGSDRCSFNGTIQPRASGKNIFDISIRYVATTCYPADTTFSGIAISYIASNGKRQFSAALQDSTKTLGTMLYAQR